MKTIGVKVDDEIYKKIETLGFEFKSDFLQMLISDYFKELDQHNVLGVNQEVYKPVVNSIEKSDNKGVNQEKTDNSICFNCKYESLCRLIDLQLFFRNLDSNKVGGVIH